MISLLSHVDIYCERTDPNLFSEPLNAATNLAFFVAAWLLHEQYKKHQVKDKEIRILIILIAIIGAGSLAFHVFSTYLTMIADVVPILCFVFYFLWVALRRVLSLSNRRTTLILLVFLGVAMLTEKVPAEYSFNGSIGYFPCLAMLVIMGMALHPQPVAAQFFKTAGLFAVALTFRSVDISVCEGFPIGTHFAWHLLNGVVLYTLTRMLMLPKTKS